MCEQKVCVAAVPAREPTIQLPAIPQSAPDGRAPYGTHVEQRPRTGMIVGGSVLLGTLWIITWTSSWAGCYQCEQGTVITSFIPVLGPFIEAGIVSSGGANGAAPFLVADGLLQGLGAGLIVAGYMLKRDVLVYDVGPLRATLTPISTPHGGGGMGIVGRF